MLRSNNNRTVLIYAAMKGKVDDIKLCLRTGVDTNSIDNDNKSALRLALEHSQKEVAILLIEKGDEFVSSKVLELARKNLKNNKPLISFIEKKLLGQKPYERSSDFYEKKIINNELSFL